MAMNSSQLAVSGIVLCVGLWSDPMLANCTVQVQQASLPATPPTPTMAKVTGSPRDPEISVQQAQVSIERSADVNVDAVLPVPAISSPVKIERSDITAHARFPAAIERAPDNSAFTEYPAGADRHGAKLTAQVEQAAKSNQGSNAPIRCAREPGI
jgi:hypothetical protein